MFNKKKAFFYKNILLYKKKSITFAVSNKNKDNMKYNELHKKLRKAGCYPTGEEIAGHPEWYSPKTGNYFPTSHHGSKEVAPKTLKNIIRDSGI